MMKQQARSILQNDCFKLKSRRYMGNKSKLTKFIRDMVYEQCGHFDSICDVFAGTGSVSQVFNNSKVKIISNDHLLSNYFALRTFLIHDDSYMDSISDKIEYLNSLKPSHDNYFSQFC